MSAPDDLALAAQLLDDDPEEPKIWVPADPGDQLVGTVQHVEFGRDQKYDRDAIAVVVRDVDGNLWLWATSQRLPVRILTERGCRAGDVIGARFEGERESTDGSRTYKNWAIKIVRDGKPVRQSRQLGGAEPAAIGTAPLEDDEWYPPDEPPDDQRVF